MSSGKGNSTPTRVSADIAATASAVANAEKRSFAEQVNHWARLGMQIERATSAEGRRVLAVAAGDTQFSSLSAQERTIAHGTIDASIAELVASDRFGPAARQAGQVTVSIDDDGNIVRIESDGSRQTL